MKSFDVSLPQLALIAGTRGMAGAGLGLLLAERVPRERRRAVGWTLLAVGALTTIPLVMQLFAKPKEKGAVNGNAAPAAPRMEEEEVSAEF